MLPEHFYFSGAGWLGYIAYAPAAAMLLPLFNQLFLRRISNVRSRKFWLVLLAVPLVTWPLLAVLMLSYEAKGVCREQGGLHVYRTVEADGILGGWGIETASKYGFKFVEDGAGERMKRWTMVDGKPVSESITAYSSKYQLQVGVDGKKIGNRFREK